MNSDPVQITYEAPEHVSKAISSLGRTEDIRFSPDQGRLAIAGFAEDKILIIDLKVSSENSRTSIALTDCLELTSPALRSPHGIDFVGNDALIATNRNGEVPVFRLPGIAGHGQRHEVAPITTIRGGMFRRLKSPGSVSVSRLPNGSFEILVCNNYIHRVTRHVLAGAPGFRVTRNELLLQHRMDIPDGVAISDDRAWIAISNHNTHSVLVYANSSRLNKHSEPDGVLHGVNYPHGVRFAPDGRSILVADAGAPFVHIYSTTDGWHGERQPSVSWRVMNDETFQKGRYNPQEGGPKGLDLHRASGILVTTCEHQALAFFDSRRAA